MTPELEGTMTPVQLLDLEAERAELGSELSDAVSRVLASGRYVLGPEVEAFEDEFARFQHTACGVGVASGTDALVLGLRALGVGPGDEVVTSPFTFFASAGAIAWIGARPVLADVELATGLLDVERAGEAMTERTRCLLPVHLYGQLADVRAFRRLADEAGATLLEDAAQAHGAERDGVRAGELGDAAAFSFYPTKNLGCAGDGGALVTRDAGVANALRLLRDHGMPAKYEHTQVGTNSRLHALQAALLRVKLRRLAEWNDRRRNIAAGYDEALAGLERVVPLVTAAQSRPVHHQYTVRLVGLDRERVLEHLGQRGIQAAVHYPRPVHLQPAAEGWGFPPGSLPVAERLAREVLCLPVHPFLSAGDAARVAEALREAALA